MNPDDTLADELRRQIQAREEDDAIVTASKMGPTSGDILYELGSDSKPSVRRVVLSVAARVPSIGASRTVLERLNDRNEEVRSVAHSLIGICEQKEVIPDLLKALRNQPQPEFAGALALQ